MEAVGQEDRVQEAPAAGQLGKDDNPTRLVEELGRDPTGEEERKAKAGAETTLRHARRGRAAAPHSGPGWAAPRAAASGGAGPSGPHGEQAEELHP